MSKISIATIEAASLVRELNNDLLKASERWIETARGINNGKPEDSPERVDYQQPFGAYKTYIDNTTELLTRIKTLLD